MMAMASTSGGLPTSFENNVGQPGLPFGVNVQDLNESDVFRSNDYVGCDWLNELSISIRQVKKSAIPNEE